MFQTCELRRSNLSTQNDHKFMVQTVDCVYTQIAAMRRQKQEKFDICKYSESTCASCLFFQHKELS